MIFNHQCNDDCIHEHLMKAMLHVGNQAQATPDEFIQAILMLLVNISDKTKESPALIIGMILNHFGLYVANKYSKVDLENRS